MSIYFSGSYSRSSGVVSAISKQLKLVNLKPAKRIEVKFDPFHPKAVTARDFLFHISSSAVTNTNFSCAIKANVVCDRSEPEITVDISETGGKIKFLVNNLTVLEILKLFNKHVSSVVKAEEPVKGQLTKIERKKR